jgi:hypothetical protein
VLALYNSALLLDEFYEASNKMNKTLRIKAYSKFQQLTRLNPNDPNNYFNLALMEMDDHRYIDALEYFNLTLQV